MAYTVGESDERPWGRWKVIEIGDGFAVKRIEVDAGGILSLQRHKFRAEHWIIVSGHGRITLNEGKTDVTKDNNFYIPTNAWHRIENIGNETLAFIEVQTGDRLDESDIERRDDKYNRLIRRLPGAIGSAVGGH